MKGKIFVEIINNKVQAQGLIVDEVSPGFWNVRFFPPGEQKDLPPMYRIVPVQNMVAMIMFDNHEELQAFLAKALPAEEAPKPKRRAKRRAPVDAEDE